MDSGLGLVSLTAMGRIGQTGCEGTEWESETSVRCLVGHGAGGTMHVAMTAGERGGSSSAAMSFDSGSVAVSLQWNRAGTGSASVTVHGSGLGLVSLTAMGRMGQTGCEGTEWESETSVRCLVGHGSRETRRLTFTTGERGGSMSEAYSLDARSLSVMRRSNHGSTGTASVTVHGSSLGSAALTAMGRMGQTGCEGTEWESETSVRCLVGHGARGTRRVAMTAGDRSGSMSEAYSSDMTGASMTSRGNRAGTGSASVTVHGSGLGLVSLTAMGRMGQTGCEGTEWESETSVRCLVGHGARGTRRVAMTAGDRSGSMSGAYSSDMSGASMTSRENRAGTGSASVTVHGSGLGLVSLTAMGRMGQTGCEGTEWESETSVRCLVGQGIQGTQRVAVTAGERDGTGSAMFSMQVGSLSASRESNRAGTWSGSVTVHGSGLGLVSLTAMGRIGQTGCEGTEWESETSVRCLVGHGVRATRRVAMTAGERGGSSSAAMSFDSGSVGVSLQRNRAGTGSASVTVHGSGLGLVSLTALGRMGQTGCEGTEWESETSVRCLVGHGSRETRRLTFTTGERGGSMSEAYSLDARSLSVMRRSNHGSTGTASVTVHGSSLGSAALTAMGRMGQTGCEGTEWESETSVRCLVGHGARGTRRVAMTAGDRSGSMSEAYSSDMTGASMTSRGNRAGTGSASVTVHGSGLGLVSLTAMGRMGQTGCEGTEWESETSVRCLVGRGIQGTRRVVMTAGERDGTGSAMYSMQVGSLSATRESNRAGTWSGSVTVHGAGLGLVSLTAMGRIGQTGCEGTEWESETSVRCLVGHGVRATRRVEMTAGERGGSSSAAMSFDSGSFGVSLQRNRAGTGSASVTVHGSGLGLVSLTAMGRMGQTGCEGTEWESETSVRCLVGHGSRETRRLTFTTGERGGSMSEAYSLDARSLSVMRRSNHGSTGTASVTVHGSSLGSAALTAMGRMGQTGCEGTEWESETSVRCLVGHGARGTRRVAMTAGDRSGSMSEAYSSDMTGASMTSRGNRAGTGSASVTVHGSGLGLVSLTAMGRMGQTGCEGTEWESETSVRCLVGQGIQGTRGVSMTAGERDGTGSAMYSMQVGSLSATRESNRAGTWSGSVTVHGAGLGLVSLTAMGRIGQTGCDGTEWESETSVRCLVGHGVRATRRVAMTAGERGGSSSAAMSFDSGSVGVSLQRNRAGTGSASVTVHGSGLGLVSLTAMGRMGQTGCEGTDWESETSVRCLVGHGSRETRRLTFTTGERGGSMSEAYSLDARSLSVMRRSNHGSTGTASVTVHGSSLGSAALTAMGRMGQTGCEGTEWESETSVRCLVGHGARGTRRVAMTAGDRSGSMSGAYSSDMSGASMTSRGNRAGTGSASVTVHGSGLGLVSLTAMGRMGQTGCEGTEWESETSVRCLVGQGIQGTRRVAVTAGERDGTGSAMYSMQVGSLSATRESNRAGTWSGSVTVHGAGLGLVSLTAMGRIGQTGCEGTEWESETSVRCLVGHGAGGTMHVAMTAGERGGSSSAAMSFDSGSVGVSLQRNRAGTGSASVTVHGSGLGLVSLTAMGRMGQTGCEGTEWESETSVRCLVGHGSRETRRLTFTTGERGGSMSEAYSLDARSLSVMRRSNHGSTGTASVTVHGSSLGSAALTAMGRMGQTGCEGTEWESETSVRCLVGHGARGTRRVAMTAGDRSGSMSEAYSSDMSGASMTSRGNRAGTGSASVTVHGSGLGLVSLTAMGRMGQTGCEGTEWESETSVRCLVFGHVSQGTRLAVVTLCELVSSSSQIFSIDTNLVSFLSPLNHAGTGSSSVTLFGSNFGSSILSSRARSGYSSCEATEWDSGTSIRCQTAQSADRMQQVMVTSGERVGTFSCFEPINDWEYVANCSCVENIPTLAYNGHLYRTLEGSALFDSEPTCQKNFLPLPQGWEIAPNNIDSRYIGSSYSWSTQVLMFSSECTPTTLSKSLWCGAIAYSADGTQIRPPTCFLQILIRKMASAIFYEKINKCVGCKTKDSTFEPRSKRLCTTMNDRATISKFSQLNQAQQDSPSVTVYGSNFGVSGFTEKVRVINTACEATQWESETSLRCLAGRGRLRSQAVVVTAGEQVGSTTAIYSVDIITMSSVKGYNTGSTGSASLTVHGSGLGMVAFTAHGRHGKTGCEGTEWASESSVRCMTGGGPLGTHTAVVTAGGRGGSISMALSMDGTMISIVRRSNTAGTGSASLTVHGSGLGMVALTSRGRLGQTGCEGTRWESETSLRCLAGRGARGTHTAVVTAEGQAGSATAVYSADAVTMSSGKRYNTGSTGSASLTVHGSGLGMVAFTAHGRTGKTGCEGTEWASESSVRCMTGGGPLGTHTAVVTAGGRGGSISMALSMDGTMISIVRRSNTAGTGSASLTVHGSGLGMVALTSRGRLGQTGCEGTRWESETSLRCLAGRGARGTHTAVVTAGGRGGSISMALSMDGTMISIVRRSNTAGTGSASLTVHGSGLGMVALTSRGRLEQTGCEGTRWESETSLRCLAGRGARGTHTAVVTAGGRGGSISMALSMDGTMISIVRRSNTAGTGSASLTVHGSGLGMVALTSRGRLEQTGCEGTRWESETSLRCLAGRGARGTHTAVVTAGGRGGSISMALSMDGTMISIVRRSNTAGTGSASLTVHGSGLGMVALTSRGRLEQTGCEGTRWESETSLRCLAGRGARGTHTAVVTAGGRGGSISMALSMDGTMISIVRRSNTAGTGSASLTVHGSGLGMVALTSRGRLGQTGCEGTRWESETSLRCLAGRGARGTHTAVVTAGGRGGSISMALSMDGTMISIVRRSNTAGTGSASLTVHGSGLGMVALTSRGRLGQTGCEGTRWESETSLRCLAGRGARGTHTAVVTAGGRGGSISMALSMDGTMISIVRRSNTAGTGSASLTVHGSGLGMVALTSRGRLGQTGCEGTRWESETSLRCLAGRGARGTHTAVVTAGGRGGSISMALSMDGTMISIVRRSNTAGTGSASLTVHGSGLGMVALTSRGRLEQTGCEGTRWESETSLRCLAGRGARGTHTAVVTAGGRGGSISMALSMDGTMISIVRRSNTAGTGSASLTVHGSGLGMVALTSRGRLEQTGCEGTRWESETSLRCLAGRGARGTHTAVVTAGGRGGSISMALSMDGTMISIVRRSNTAGTGSASLTVHGSGLGMVALTSRGRLEQTGCEGTRWESETSLRCLAGRGARGTHTAVVTAGGRGGSISMALSMDGTMISIVRRSNTAGTGSASLTVHGSGLGMVALTSRGRLEQTGCEGTRWESETSLRCLAGRGARGTHTAVVTAGGRGGSISMALSMDGTMISIVRRSNTAGTGSASLTVHGSGLGMVALTSRGRLGQTGCEGTRWESETSLRCLAGRGARGTHTAVVTAGGRGGSISMALSMDGTMISIVRRSNTAGTGSASLTVHGSGLGMVALTSRGRLGQTGCEGTRWESETSLRCLAGRGARGTHTAVVTAEGQAGSATAVFSVQSGSMSSGKRYNMGSTGSASLTVHGSGLGMVAFTAHGRHGKTGCEGTEWVSESSVRCRTAGGPLGTHTAVVTAGGRGGSISMALSMDGTMISIVRRSNTAGTGSASLTVHGSGLGMVALTSRGRLGQTGCEGTRWESETSLRCLAGRGARGTHTAVVTAEGQAGSATAVYSADAGSMSSGKRYNTGSTGSASLTVHGSGHGMVALTAMGRIGQSGCERTVWISSSTVVCRVGPGHLLSQHFVISVQSVTASVTEIHSLDASYLSTMSLTNGARFALTSLTLYGVNLGTVDQSIAVGLSSSSCESSAWTSDIKLLCLSSMSYQQSRSVSVTSGTRLGSMSVALSFDIATISSAESSDLRSKNLKTKGGQILYVASSSLVAHSGSARIGYTGCESTQWASRSSITCKTSAGVSKSLKLVVTSGNTRSSLSLALSFDVPGVKGALPSNLQSVLAAWVTVLGIGFGTELGYSQQGQIGETSSQATRWISDSSLACKSHGLPSNRLEAVITVGASISAMSSAVSYDGPSLSSLSRTNVRPVLGQIIKFDGFNFALIDISSTARLGETACGKTAWLSATTIMCHVSQFAQTYGTSSAVVSVGMLIPGTRTEAWSADVPSPVQLTAANVAPVGRGVMTLHGMRIAQRSLSAQAGAGHTACESSRWISETTLACTSASGVGGSMIMRMTVCMQVGSITEFSSFDLVALKSSTNTNSPKLVPLRLSIVYGAGIGRSAYTSVVSVGGSGCETSVWVSETSILCRVTSGTQSSQHALITAGLDTGSLSIAFSVDVSNLKPELTKKSNTAHTVSLQVTLHGGNMVRSSANARAGQTATEATRWESGTSVLCLLAGSGMRGTRPIQLTAGLKTGSLTSSLSFDAMGWRMTARANGAGTGSTSLAVLVVKIGVVAYTSSVGQGHTGCQHTDWRSATSIICKVARGISGTHSVSVTAGEIAGSLSEAYSVDRASGLIAALGRNQGFKASAPLHMLGAGLGVTMFTDKVRIGVTGCEATAWTSVSSLACSMAPSVSGSKLATVTMGWSVESMNNAFSVDAVALSSFDGLHSNAPKSGSIVKVVKGSGIGRSAYTSVVSVGGSGCETSVWVSETSILCRVTSGTQSSQHALITAGLDTGSLSIAFSVDVSNLKPELTKKSNTAHTVSLQVTLHGGNMVRSSANARAGQTATEATRWESGTSVLCLLAGSGMRGTRPIQLTAGLKTGSLTSSLSFDAMGWRMTARANGAGTGSTSLAVLVVKIGVVAYTSSVGQGHTGCQHTDWRSATSIICKVARGISGTHSVSVTAGEIAGSLSEAYSVDRASGLIAALGRNQGFKASAPLHMLGAGLGVTMFTDKVRIGVTGCEATAWTSVSSLACSMAPSVSGSKLATVTMGWSVESMNNAFSVDAVALSAAEGILPYTGYVTVKAVMDLLSRAYTMQAKMGTTTCSYTTWQSESSLMCRASSSVGSSKSFVVTIGHRSCSITEAVSMQSGIVQISPNFISNRACSATSVSVYGTGFGQFSNSIASRIGHSANMHSVWKSDTSIAALVASGSGTSYRLMITVGVTSSTGTKIISYDGPRLLKVSNFAVQPQGILMVGGSLSSHDATAAARLGHTVADKTRWTSESAVTCYVEQHVGASRLVSVTVGVTPGSCTESFSFASTLMQAFGNLASKSVLTLSGGSTWNHGSHSTSVKLGSTACAATFWSSTTNIMCRSARGHSSSRHVEVTTGIVVVSSTSVISYSSPTVLSISSANAGWLVQKPAAVFGFSLGQSIAVSAGHSQSEFSSWVSETSVLSKCARGSGSSHSLVLTAGMSVGSISKVWSIDAGQVSALKQSNSAPSGQTLKLMAVKGTVWDVSSRARLASTHCESSLWYSSSSITCAAAAGAESALTITITTDSQIYTVSGVATYDAPNLVAGGPTNAPTASQQALMLTGTNLMHWSLSPRIKVGHTASPSSMWISFSSVLGMTPPGGLTSPHYALVISMAQDLNTRSRAFTYDMPAISGAEISQTKDQARLAIVDLLGKNFGATDHSLGAAIGIVFCGTTQWVSDSTILCAVPRSFDENSVVRSARDGKGKICIQCAAGFTVACSSSDSGYCVDCITCGTGFQTVNCNAVSERRYCFLCPFTKSTTFLFSFLSHSFCFHVLGLARGR
jgi:DNA-directed RNA polymerase subunit H (RpoH/RPB5)